MYVLENQKKGYKTMGETKTNNSLKNEKEIVTEAEVIVRRTNQGFYFMIKYKYVGDKDYTLGYGSYNIHFVFQWLDEYFEIVSQEKGN